MAARMQHHRPPDPTQRRRRIGVLCLAALTVAVVLVALAGGGSHPGRPAAQVQTGATAPSTTAATVASSAVSSTTVAPTVPSTTAPPTTVDPGSLPQTTVLPSGSDPAFIDRMDDLWGAITTGNPAAAQAAFFPLSAYVQVKGISDPVHDYQTRLIADYDEDIDTLHAELGGSASSATLVGVQVPDAAQWIQPGVEYNKGSYYRVYSSSLTYELSGVDHTFTIASMISWRGEWYVVHLNSIR
jgi:hypothetical protein